MVKHWFDVFHIRNYNEDEIGMPKNRENKDIPG